MTERKPIDRTKYLDADEERRLRDVTSGWAAQDLAAGRRAGVIAWALVDLALSTGFRRLELCRLRCGDINLTRRTIDVRRAKKRRECTDTLPLAAECAKHLRDYLAWKRNVGESVEADAPLIAGRTGQMSERGLWNIWRKAVARAGLRPIGLHAARHTVGVRLYRQTKDVLLVRRMLGHANLKDTLIYAEASFEDLREAVDAAA